MNNYYLIYVTGYCPWCVKAINMINESGMQYAITLLDQALDYRRDLKMKYKWDTVPIVIEVSPSGEETLIGGYTDLRKRFVELGLVEDDDESTGEDTAECGEEGCSIEPDDSTTVSE
jgi:glutaredoxin